MLRGRTALVFASLLGIVGWAALAGVASAQEVALPERGTTEYSIAGLARFTSPSFQTISVGWKPFINRNWQWGAEFSYTNQNRGDDFGTIAGVLNYYLRQETEGRTLPYVGISLGLAFGDLDEFVYGAQVGLKHFLNDNVALFGELQWRHHEDARPRNPVDLVIGLAFFR